jgi:phosphoenolpyruvate carboxylase
MPLTAEYLDPIRQQYEQEFQQYMLNLAGRSNLIYRDFIVLWPQANDYFSDPSHLNRYGAYEVSQKLAIDPMIPWPAK